MTIRIICIGDELLNGDTINTNLAQIGNQLAQHGLTVAGEQCVPDDQKPIRQALNHADGADAVIVVGGLGATGDDLTRETVAAYLNRPLACDAKVAEAIQRFLGQRAAGHETCIRIQAQVPQGAVPLINENGTAPGLMIPTEHTLWFLLPGPPREMIPMLQQHVLPRILAKTAGKASEAVLRVRHTPEHQAEEIARKALLSTEGIRLATCLKPDHVMLRISTEEDGGRDIIDQALATLRTAFANRALPPDCTTTAHYLGQVLMARQLVMSTAESCTGGGIAQTITAIPGSSEWFVGGVVTYANEWKQKFLGVKAETLKNHGAVSEETVHEMLDGLKNRCGVPAGVAVSGIAGPGGGTPQKPVGTVVIGAFAPGWKKVMTMHYPGLRDTVRQHAIAGCLNLLLDGLLGEP